MKRISKNKALGQYFSGELVADVLSTLAECKPGQSIIDPMAGIGDMFTPFNISQFHCSAIEIDPAAYQTLIDRVPTAICANAFSKEALESYKKRGYDLVITNPPYVRWQNLNDSSDLPNYLSIQNIYDNLLNYTKTAMTLNHSERLFVNECLSSLSGLSDLAIPSWLLCMLLTKRSGVLAIVVPNSWMSREYSLPIIRVLKNLFDIEVVLSDVNSVLFKGKALVQTNLIIARRHTTASSSDNYIRFISAYSSLWNSSDYLEKLKKCIQDNKNEKGVCELRLVNQRAIWNANEAPHLSSYELSSIKSHIHLCPSNISDISSFGIKCFQGLRSGANAFFYLQRQKRSLIASDGHVLSYSKNQKNFLPSIQAQEDLSNTYSQGEVKQSYLLYLQDKVVTRDQGTNKAYAVVPNDLENYILDSEKRQVNDIFIPNLSAVKTNVRIERPGVKPRYWYMLPPLSKRHTAPLFFPRLNSGRVYVRKNTYAQVIDANFVTIIIQDDARLTVNAALALLNSTWSSIQFEENCTVMGGGALKVDSVQMDRFFFPTLSDDQLNELDTLGEKLSNMSLDETSIIDEIDHVILRSIPDVRADDTILLLHNLLTDYINRRNAVR